ncbi:type II secretion system protein [Candidatus Woesebacteria bacterium]|nr:type II secretion system protein [Candidatus Woesebacteria bacterium]
MGISTHNRGYTLLEVVIVISIFALIVPAMFSMYFASLRAQKKVFVLRDTKRNGDNALTVIESLIKQNAISIHNAEPPTSANQVCTSAVPSGSGALFFKDKDGTWFSFTQSNFRIASSSASTLSSSSVNLTNTKSLVTNFNLRCAYVSDVSPPLVSISFNINQNGPTGRAEEVSSLGYQTKIKLRSY